MMRKWWLVWQGKTTVLMACPSKLISTLASARSLVFETFLVCLCCLPICSIEAGVGPRELADLYARQVDRKIAVPFFEIHLYAELSESAMAAAGISARQEYVVVVDRNPHTQLVLLMWRSALGKYRLIGASPVSTGQPGRFDHFVTPLGVFLHGLDNPDFRAEGTYNENGIRGYGVKGMRVYDFGWQMTPRGWGDGHVSQMRLQMHATDPVFLEPRLGHAQSKGCIRIPASLNRLLDLHGVIDAEYEQAVQEGRQLGVLLPHRQPVPEAGRFLIVVDSMRTARPRWMP
jgi:hypothetical protein